MGWRTCLSPCAVNIPAMTHSPLAETVYLGVLPVCTFLLELITQLLDVWWARSSLTGTIKELQACRWRVKKKSLCCRLCGIENTKRQEIRSKTDVMFTRLFYLKFQCGYIYLGNSMVHICYYRIASKTQDTNNSRQFLVITSSKLLSAHFFLSLLSSGRRELVFSLVQPTCIKSCQVKIGKRRSLRSAQGSF